MLRILREKRFNIRFLYDLKLKADFPGNRSLGKTAQFLEVFMISSIDKMKVVFLAAIVTLMLAACPDPVAEDEYRAQGSLTPGPGTPAGTLNIPGYANSVPAFDSNNLPPVAYWNNEVGEIVNLPNPFVFADGTPVYSEADWERRRAEIQKILEYYETGLIPPPPDTVTVSGGNADGSGTWTVTVGANNRTANFTITITFPSHGNAPNGSPINATDNKAPALLGGFEFFRDNGYATITDNATGSDGLAGVVQNLFQYDNVPSNLDYPSSLARAAWVTGRIIDAIEAGAGGGKIDPDKLLTTGISRGGKNALWQGAFAVSKTGKRIAVTNPVSSGAAGVAIERFVSLPFKETIYQKSINTIGGTPLTVLITPEQGEAESITEMHPEAGRNGSIQSMPSIMTDSGGNWVSNRFKQFTNLYPHWKVNRNNARASYFGITGTMPFDSHFMTALIAPRGLMIHDGWRSPWTNPEGTYFNYLATREVYDFLGASDNIGIRIYDVTHSNPTREQYDFLYFSNMYFNRTFGDTYHKLSTESTYPEMTDIEVFKDNDPAYGGLNIATWYDPRNKDGLGRYDYLKLNWANPKKGLGASVADIVKDKTGWTND
jgi:hypothetical protein